MSSKIEKLSEVICSKNEFKLNQVKVKINVFNDTQLMDLLVTFLNQQMNALNRNNYFVIKSYFYKALSYLDECVNNFSYVDDSKINKELEKIKRKITKLIRLCDYHGTKGVFIDNDFILEKIKNNIDFIITHKKPINIETIDEANIDDFIRYLIFDVKKIRYIEEIVESFPELINNTNDGKSIIDEIIERYIKNVVKSNGYYNAIYLEKVIKSLINNPKIKISEEQKKNTIMSILKSLERLKRIRIKKEDKQRIKFQLNELLHELRDISTKDYNWQMTNINYKYDMGIEFNKNIKRELYRIKKINGHYYSDLRDKQIITIDRDGSGCLDDAFSLERLPNGNYLLGVYITDIATYIKSGDYLDLEAYKRSKTIYLPKRTITIFPPELAYDFFSLKSNKDKLVYSHLFEFSPDMYLVNYDVDRSIISVNSNLYFNEVNNILNNEKNVTYYPLLKEMRMFAEKLKNQNLYKELYHDIKSIRKSAINDQFTGYDNSIASNIVMEFKILINHFIALLFFEMGIPSIYRVNLSNFDNETIVDLKQKWQNNNKIEDILYCINQIYEPSVYSTNNLGHYGLNLNAYTSASTPARNYISLVIQRLENKFLINDEKMTDKYCYELEERLALICKHINERNELNDAYAEEYTKILTKQYKSN